MSNIGNKETMARNLKYYIEKSGRTQKDIAEVVGVATSTFNDWVKAKKYPRIDKIEIMADYFGILKSDLIEEKSMENNPKELAVLHAKILTDDNIMEMLEDFISLDAKQQKAVKDLVHSMAKMDV